MEKDPNVHTPAEGIRIIGVSEAASRETASNKEPNPKHLKKEKPKDVDLTESEDPSPPGMQHWTEPPTGEVPSVLTGDDLSSSDEELSSGPIWKDNTTGWESDEAHELISSIDSEEGVTEPEEAPLPTNAFTDVEPEDGTQPSVTISTRVPHNNDLYDEERKERGIPMNSRVLTGFGIAGIAALSLWLGSATCMVLVLALVVLGTSEFYDAQRRIGLKPATLVGLVANCSLIIAAYARGEGAIPIVLGLATITTLIWFLLGASPGRPLISTAVTLTGILWPGLLACFASLILRLPDDRGIALIWGTVIATGVYDVAAFVAGRQYGQRKLLPQVSPTKTIEGAIGGSVATLLVSIIIVMQIHPWDNLGNVIALGLVVAFLAPLGDLCESLIKRDLGIKDMGNYLPGHGGILDRVDSLLFVIPAVYFLARVLHIA